MEKEEKREYRGRRATKWNDAKRRYAGRGGEVKGKRREHNNESGRRGEKKDEVGRKEKKNEKMDGKREKKLRSDGREVEKENVKREVKMEK